MKIKCNINLITFLVLCYPLVLFVPSVFKKEAFFITAPYFFALFLAFMIFTLARNKVALPNNQILLILLSVTAISLYNFSTIRFSMPIFFLIFSFLLAWVLFFISDRVLNHKIPLSFFAAYVIASVPFLFTDTGYTNEQRFMGFVGSPTVYSGFLTALFVIISLPIKLKSLKFITLYFLTFWLVYITKTRLILVFLIIYPILREVLFSKIWLTRKNVFLVFYGTTFFIYPLYNRVTEWFPSLIALRYGTNEDTSFSLRNYLFLECEKEYYRGNWVEMLFGKGNEYSRNLVKSLLNIDLMPHNDYMRILIDWGLMGLILFSLLIYKLATKNNYTFFLVLVYMILFYSNTIFNMYLMAIILIFYFRDDVKGSSNKVVFSK